MQLSVAMPVYNEEGAVAAAVEEVQREVLDLVADSELVVVNDGSRDGSGEVLDKLAAADPRIRVIHQTNKGHGGALMAAVEAARGDYVLLIDSDRQISLADFRRAWDEVSRGRDGVFGVRRKRHDPVIRLHLTRWVRRSIRLLFGVFLADANVPYKLVRRAIWEEARAHIPDGTLAPSLFLAIYVRRRQLDVIELDVTHRERGTGEVSIRRWKLVKFCLRAFRQMLVFRRSLRHVNAS